jgi:hypothetical protein
LPGHDPLLPWVQRELEQDEVIVENWTSSWSDGIAFYMLIALRRLPTLDIKVVHDLTPRMRDAEALVACQKLGIFVYVSPGDMIRNCAIATKMQVQEVLNYTFMGPRPTELLAPPLPRAEGRRPPEVESRYSLGIDFGASKIRFSLFSKTEPEKDFPVIALDNIVSVGPDGRLFAGTAPDLTPIPSARALLGRQFNDPSLKQFLENYPLPTFAHHESGTYAINIEDRVAVTPEAALATMLNAVRRAARRIAGEPVFDV